jgi:hypothetical protein
MPDPLSLVVTSNDLFFSIADAFGVSVDSGDQAFQIS